MGTGNSKEIVNIEQSQESKLNNVRSLCKTTAEQILKDPTTEGQKMLKGAAELSSPQDTNKQLTIIETYLLNISSWESIGVFNAFPSNESSTFVIPKGTILWKSGTTNADEYQFETRKERALILDKSFKNLSDNGGIWCSSLEMAYSFYKNHPGLTHMAAFVLPDDISLFPIENKNAVFALMNKVKTGKYDDKEKFLREFTLITGFSADEWFVGLRQLKELYNTGSLKIINALMFMTPRNIIGHRVSLHEDRTVISFIEKYRGQLKVDGWIEHAGILQEAEMAIARDALIGSEKYEIGIEPARTFLKEMKYVGLDSAFVRHIKLNWKRRLPEYVFYMAAIVTIQAWWIRKSRLVMEEVNSSWAEHKATCALAISVQPTEAFLKATLLASKCMIPAAAMFEPDNGELLTAAEICNVKFDKNYWDLLRTGFFIFVAFLMGHLGLSLTGLLLLKFMKNPWLTIQEAAKEKPVTLSNLNFIQKNALMNIFGQEWENSLLALPIPSLRSLVLKKIPTTRAYVFIDVLTGQLRTKQADIIAKIFA